MVMRTDDLQVLHGQSKSTFCVPENKITGESVSRWILKVGIYVPM
jgi:hypothetical protein